MTVQIARFASLASHECLHYLDFKFHNREHENGSRKIVQVKKISPVTAATLQCRRYVELPSRSIIKT